MLTSSTSLESATTSLTLLTRLEKEKSTAETTKIVIGNSELTTINGQPASKGQRTVNSNMQPKDLSLNDASKECSDERLDNIESQSAKNKRSPNDTSHMPPCVRYTRLCIRYLHGECYHPKCPFAHGLDQLRVREDLTRTRMCEEFVRAGSCAKAEDCTFAHAEEELRSTPDLFKTKLCPDWITGHCNNTSCRYAHGCKELRQRKRATSNTGTNKRNAHKLGVAEPAGLFEAVYSKPPYNHHELPPAGKSANNRGLKASSGLREVRWSRPNAMVASAICLDQESVAMQKLLRDEGAHFLSGKQPFCPSEYPHAVTSDLQQLLWSGMPVGSLSMESTASGVMSAGGESSCFSVQSNSMEYASPMAGYPLPTYDRRDILASTYPRCDDGVTTGTSRNPFNPNNRSPLVHSGTYPFFGNGKLHNCNGLLVKSPASSDILSLSQSTDAKATS